MNRLSLALISPGTSSLPPSPSTSVEIYLYDLWSELHSRVDVRLYGRKEVLEGGAKAEVRRKLVRAAGKHYLPEVMADLCEYAGRSPNLVQVDNRPKYVKPLARRSPATPIVLGLHSMTFLDRTRITSATALSHMNHAAKIVVNSHYVAEVFRRSFPDLEGRLAVVHPGVDIKKFHPAQSEAEHRQALHLRERLAQKSDFVILFVGRIIERKGVHVAVAALRELLAKTSVRATLWVAGAKPRENSAYAKLLHQATRGLPVTWLGFVKRAQIPMLYRASDILLCSSQKPEAFGLVNLEAQASGVPVVASDDWGIRESVADGKSGVLVNRYRDPKAFAAVLSDLARDADRYRALAEEGVRLAQARFSWQRVSNHYLELYRNLT